MRIQFSHRVVLYSFESLEWICPVFFVQIPSILGAHLQRDRLNRLLGGRAALKKRARIPSEFSLLTNQKYCCVFTSKSQFFKCETFKIKA